MRRPTVIRVSMRRPVSGTQCPCACKVGRSDSDAEPWCIPAGESTERTVLKVVGDGRLAARLCPSTRSRALQRCIRVIHPRLTRALTRASPAERIVDARAVRSPEMKQQAWISFITSV